jgi:hydroxyacylglutathione hydrolase
MIQIQTFIVGQLQTNCYVITDSSTSKCIILDPGDAGYLISEHILQNLLTPTAIVATHGHFDHILAANELQLAFNIPFIIHKKDIKILNYMNKSATHWLKQEMIEQPPTDITEMGKEITFGNTTLSVIETPGHTPGGVCLYNHEQKVVFTGDTIFNNNAYGRTDLSYGNSEDMVNSLKVIRERFEGYRGYAGHEGEFVV